MYSIAVPEVRSPRSKCHQGHSLSEGSRGEFITSLAPRFWGPSSPWCSLTCRCITPVMASVVTWPLPSLCVCVSSPRLIRTLLILDQGPPYSSMMSSQLITSVVTLLPYKVSFWSSGKILNLGRTLFKRVHWQILPMSFWPSQCIWRLSLSCWTHHR